jgi:preprotein translocase subunit SecF
MRIFHNLNVDFMGKRNLFYALSGLILLAGLISILVKGVAFGLDFKGGTEIVARFPHSLEISDLRTMLHGHDLGSMEIKSFGKDTDWIIRTERVGVGAAVADKVKLVLDKNFAGKVIILQENRVEAKIGKEIRTSALIAVFVSLIGILVYIAFRFKFVFGVGAVLSLFHDVLLTLGLVSIFTNVIPGLNLDFDQALVAAFLTLIGYSINDTVIVFDRVRENLKLFKTADFGDIINKSVNRTMSRTIITSFVTMLAMVGLLFFGGEPTRGFAFVMVIGIITGTYSSVFVAASMTYDWARIRKTKITF